MRKAVLLTLLTIATSKAISQNSSNDTTPVCLPAYQLRIAINKIENAKVVEEELRLTQSKVSTLEKIITNKDQTLTQYQKKDSLNSLTISNYQKVIQNNNSTVKNLETTNQLTKLQLKRQKLKKWAGVAIGVCLGILIGNQ